MTVFRLLMVFVLFPLLLVGCQTPFIDVNVGTSGGGGQLNPGCYPPWSVCPGQYSENWQVVGVYPASDKLTIYEVQRGDERRSLFVPPVQHKDPKKPPQEKDLITIERIGDGALEIAKVNSN